MIVSGLKRIVHAWVCASVDIEAMLDAVDLDGSGEMEYDEFELLLSGKAQTK